MANKFVIYAAAVLLVARQAVSHESETGTNLHEAFCPTPPAPVNGQVNCMTVHLSAQQSQYLCTFTCDAGYKFKGIIDSSYSTLCVNGAYGFNSRSEPPLCVSVCEDPQPPTPLVILSCSNKSNDEKVCKARCQTYYRFESPAEKSYSCKNGDNWSPLLSTIPRCVSRLTLRGKMLVPGEAVCSVWGQHHYRTFDNKIYTFRGQCKYVLTYVPNTFTIMVVNDAACNGKESCTREVEIYFGDNSIALRSTPSGPSITWNGKNFTVPGSHAGTVIEQIGNYISVRSSLRFSVKWDGKQSVTVQVTDELREQVSGLCGTYNGDPSDDFENDQGIVVTSIASFGNSWKKTDLSDGTICADNPQDIGCDPTSLDDAYLKCADLLNDPAFKLCHSVVDPGLYIEACKTDCCAQNSQECTCGTMEAYSRACLEKNIVLNWRKSDRCERQCPAGTVYKECGSSCVPDCFNIDASCSDPTCVDGCFCPDGWVTHNGQCIESVQCPCSYGSKEYHQGSVIAEQCNNCICTSGKWQCTHKTCDALCSVMGDSHYLTFDGTWYDFMGSCSYYLVKHPEFNVIVNNERCSTAGTCSKSLTLETGGFHTKLEHNFIVVNGEEVASLPYQNADIRISKVSSLFIQVALKKGVSIIWDEGKRIYVKAPPSLKGKLSGLCGTYDSKQNNDFLTPQGSLETNNIIFANQWKTVKDCADVPVTIEISPCETNSQRRAEATQYCGQLKSDIFQTCHDVEDVQQYYDNCMYDMCACKENLRDCFCPSLGIYSDACAAKGIKINWRVQVKECALQCPPGQDYQVCIKPCEHTCLDLALSTDKLCDQKCVEGCSCPEDQSLDVKGQCVPAAHCPCLFDGREYSPGFTTLKGTEICMCSGAKWQCSRISYNKGNFTKVQPLCPINMEYSPCASHCPKTCGNLDSKDVCVQSSDCKAACVCKDGYVLEGDICIIPTKCPCYHGGKAYYEGDKYFTDCNECVCKNQKWQCENKDCPATCSAYGDSHYHTFDGRTFEFQGSCDYVMTQSTADNSDKFFITTTNLQCGSTGVTCAKGIEITVGEEGTISFFHLQLVKGKKTVADPDSPFFVREVGEMIFVTMSNGVSVQWDQGTRLYIRLAVKHIGKVEGLCGNFNGDQSDDFRPRSGGLTVAKATTFADSWRVHSFCESAQEIMDTCERAPQRKSWAQHKCSILKSEHFQVCHTFIDPREYIKRCVYDACGCDSGDDCNCLCTAISAYAQECATHGVPINWRTKELCGLACNGCYEYNPCISLCAKKTCDNRLFYTTATDNCEDQKGLCFEGCDLHRCPEGQVYDSLVEPISCIPEPLCDSPACEVNGKKYREGERISDPSVCRSDCEICNCRNGKIEHISLGYCEPITVTFHPTPPIEVYTDTPPTTPRDVPKVTCTPGWTAWMSAVIPTYANVGDRETVTGLRGKYSFCHENQITDIHCRIIGRKDYGNYFGQNVTCGLQSGLTCYHRNQQNAMCFDYEVSFSCDCSKPTPPTSGTGVPPSQDTDMPPTSGTSVPPSEETDIPPTPGTGVPPTSGTDIPPTSGTGVPPTSGTGVPPTSGTGVPPSEETDIPPTPGTGVPPTSGTGVPSTSGTGVPPSEETDIPPTPGTGVPPTSGTGIPPTPDTDIPPTPQKVVSPTPGTGVPPSSGTDVPPTSGTGLPPSEKTEIPPTPGTGVPPTSGTGIPPSEETDIPPTPGTALPPTSGTGIPPTSGTGVPPSEETDIPPTPGTAVPPTLGTGIPSTTGTDLPPISTPDTGVPPTPGTGVPPGTAVPPGSGATPTPGTTFSPSEVCGWTPWMNSFVPNNLGDLESMSNLRLFYIFCHQPVSIKCRTVPDLQNPQGISYDQTGQVGVTCDLNRGLVCLNSAQKNGQVCSDFEVAVKCVDACTTDIPQFEITTPSSTRTTSPISHTSGHTGIIDDTTTPHGYTGVEISSTPTSETPLLPSTHDDESTTTPDEETTATFQPPVTYPPVTKGNRVCDQMMGLSNKKKFMDDQFEASSSISTAYDAYNGRLNNFPKGRSNGGAWMPKPSDPEPCLIINLKYPYAVSGIVSQGRPNAPQWVTKYKVFISIDGSRFIPFKDGDLDKQKIFYANQNNHKSAKVFFSREVVLRKIAVCPTDFKRAIALRVDLMSCDGIYTTAPPYKPGFTYPTYACSSTWSEWIDRQLPSFEDGEREALSEEEIEEVCPYGKMTDVRCIESGDIKSTSPQPPSSCTLEKGYTCENPELIPGRDQPLCVNYRIQYFCDCDAQTNPPPPTTEAPKQKIECGWSSWLNLDKPAAMSLDPGDLETIAALQSKFGLCSDIVDIKCRIAGTSSFVLNETEAGVMCNALDGLRCFNRDMTNGRCHDYEVSVLCWDNDSCPGTRPPHLEEPTGTPSYDSTPPISIPPEIFCPPGKEWQACAFKCDEVCHYMGLIAGACFEKSTVDCIPGCVPIDPDDSKKCLANQRQLDSNTCVEKAACTCLKPDGTIAKPFETWSDPDSPCASQCSCFNNEVTCQFIDECTTVDLSRSTPSTPEVLTVSPDLVMPVCGWSDWINEDTPNQGNGDSELLSSFRSKYGLCSAPTAIECRDANTWQDIRSSGQQVTCSKSEGLRCWNSDNDGKCNDYEIRVFCPCATPPPETDTTPTGDYTGPPGLTMTDTPTTTDPSPVTVTMCGWTDWMSAQSPTSNGDLETVASLRKTHIFCGDSSILSIRCRDSATKKTAEELGQQKVLCDLTFGLVCFNADQPDGQCANYEVSFLCDPVGIDCSGLTPTVGVTGPDGSLATTPFGYSPDWTTLPGNVTIKKTTYVPPESTTELPSIKVCDNPLKDASPIPVHDSSFSSSSSLSKYTGPQQSRLNTQEETLFSGAWIPLFNSKTQWIKVMLPEPVLLMGIITQGRHNVPEWVKSYQVLYSLDGNKFYNLQKSDGNTIFNGNTDSNTENRENVQPTHAKVVLIHPETWQTRIALRFQLLGCVQPFTPTSSPPDSTGSTPEPPFVLTHPPTIKPPPEICQEEMGLRDSRITDDMISASSFRDVSQVPQYARLGGSRSWMPASSDENPYVQIDFREPQIISAITTQGRPDAPLYVISYKVFYSTDGSTWIPYRETPEEDKIFYGNWDSSTPVTQYLKRPVRAKLLRVCPQTWNDAIALRLELHGCAKEFYPTPSPTPSDSTKISTITSITTTKEPSRTDVSTNCIEWDQWLDLNQPTLTNRDDVEPIADLIVKSLHCRHPMAIECRQVTISQRQSKTTQKISCNLWEGLKCLSSEVQEPMCYNYQVRLGCQKETPECLQEPTTLHPVPVCYPDLDIQHCPDNCPQGFFCDGLKCVRKSDCPCYVDGKTIRPTGIDTKENCDICQCLNGEVLCISSPQCPPCKQGYNLRNASSCECQCLTCGHNEFQCGDGLCIQAQQRCDAIVDCIDDEYDCDFIEIFTLPTTRRPENVTEKIYTTGTTKFTELVTTGVVPITSTDPGAKETTRTINVTTGVSHATPDTRTTETMTSTTYASTATTLGYTVSVWCPGVRCPRLIYPELEEGVTIKLLRTEDGCCQEYVTCDLSKCPEPARKCGAPMISRAVPTNECCPKYECECPTSCPDPKQPVCGSVLKLDGSGKKKPGLVLDNGKKKLKQEEKDEVNGEDEDGGDDDDKDEDEEVTKDNTKVEINRVRRSASLQWNDDEEDYGEGFYGNEGDWTDSGIQDYNNVENEEEEFQKDGDEWETEISSRRQIYGPSQSRWAEQSRPELEEERYRFVKNNRRGSTWQQSRQSGPNGRQEAGDEWQGRRTDVYEDEDRQSNELRERSRRWQTRLISRSQEDSQSDDEYSQRNRRTRRSAGSRRLQLDRARGTGVTRRPRLWQVRNRGQSQSNQGDGRRRLQLQPLNRNDKQNDDAEVAGNNKWQRRSPSTRLRPRSISDNDNQQEEPEDTMENVERSKSSSNLHLQTSTARKRSSDNEENTTMKPWQLRKQQEANKNENAEDMKDEVSLEEKKKKWRAKIQALKQGTKDKPKAVQKPAGNESNKSKGSGLKPLKSRWKDRKASQDKKTIKDKKDTKNIKEAGEKKKAWRERRILDELQYEIVEIQQECNCTVYACRVVTKKPPQECYFTRTTKAENGLLVLLSEAEEAVYQLGNTWTDGPCKICRCSNDTDGNARIICTEQECAPCKLGEEQIITNGTCCGECKPNACVIDGQIFKAGETVTSKKKCFTSKCERSIFHDNYNIQETQIACDSLDKLPYCPEGVNGSAAYDDSGCCHKCLPKEWVPVPDASVCESCTPRSIFGEPQKTIGYFSTSKPSGSKCYNDAPIPELKQCDGYCSSMSVYTEVIQGFASHCKCCQPSQTKPITVDLLCDDGTHLTKQFDIPETCACMPCSGG